MSRWKHWLVVVLLILATTSCDQSSKFMAKQYLPENQVVSLFGDTVRLQYVHNSGAFLSLGASLPASIRTLVFTVGVGAIVSGILIYLLLASSIGTKTMVALSLICGGGIGNLIDRVAYSGAVVDFLNVGVGSFRTGIFNIADMAVLAGALIVLWDHIRARRGVGLKH